MRQLEAKADQSADAKAAAELVRPAKEQGLSLTGPDGLLKQLTKTVHTFTAADDNRRARGRRAVSRYAGHTR
ncbi:hypothetical protein OG799_21415 [Micromonospora sp. NBC_00898]|uniref:hypothetical protein n=1 Tax=Micromonospora sp. NBC_00898 TaxID=2975981 RepID=UPI003863B2A9|nr:hypothetical protein OG799_21415 [Micromonospora sp. NBC_00898]